MSSTKITDLDVPFYFSRRVGQGSIMMRIEGDSREICDEILDSIEICGNQSRYNLLRLDKYPKEITVFVVIDPEPKDEK